MALNEQSPAIGAVAGLAREIEEFVASGGWDQPPPHCLTVKVLTLEPPVSWIARTR